MLATPMVVSSAWNNGSSFGESPVNARVSRIRGSSRSRPSSARKRRSPVTLSKAPYQQLTWIEDTL